MKYPQIHRIWGYFSLLKFFLHDTGQDLLSLICAMILGRIVWGCAMVVILGISGSPFTWSAFLAGALLNAIPGIAVQLVLVPALVMALQRANII